MARQYLFPQNLLASAEEDSAAEDSSANSEAQFQRLVRLCADILDETARATQNMSDRLSVLRAAIESLGASDRH